MAAELGSRCLRPSDSPLCLPAFPDENARKRKKAGRQGVPGLGEGGLQSGQGAQGPQQVQQILCDLQGRRSVLTSMKGLAILGAMISVAEGS